LYVYFKLRRRYTGYKAPEDNKRSEEGNQEMKLRIDKEKDESFLVSFHTNSFSFYGEVSMFDLAKLRSDLKDIIDYSNTDSISLDITQVDV
jgi:hypothetical protein